MNTINFYVNSDSQLRSIFKHCKAVNMNYAISLLLRSAVVASEKSISNGRPDTEGLREASLGAAQPIWRAWMFDETGGD